MQINLAWQEGSNVGIIKAHWQWECKNDRSIITATCILLCMTKWDERMTTQEVNHSRARKGVWLHRWTITTPKEDHDDASLGWYWCKRRTTIMCEKDHNNTRRGLWKQKGRTRQCDKRAATRLGKDHINAGREPRQCWRRTTTMPVKTMTISYEDYNDAGSGPH